ncbi:hypothetical protein I4902_08660 [Proteus alimentorum]|uniref:Uncharacterized protein n=1 Tax=Proteus alimentorum TaxID=1973495 RepID=A0ABS0ITI5_9GAMM|nr:hypothetical protein [Proteus alimentorum]MBG2875469.1 hypothetical protein [Proteus alimentorum]MBG2879336.1 hypothetical protein [Proteus alimentorum]
MLQLITFSEMNGTYAYRVELEKISNGFEWTLSYVQHGQGTIIGQPYSASSLNVAFDDAVKALFSYVQSNNQSSAIPNKIQYMVSKGMMNENDITSVLFANNFNPKVISCY